MKYDKRQREKRNEMGVTGGLIFPPDIGLIVLGMHLPMGLNSEVG